MKKSMKTLFVLMVLSLFTIIGINTVKAESSVTNFNVVCEPGEIEKGDVAFCYIIGKVTNDASTQAGVHGLLTKVTTSHLNINSYKAGDGSAKFVAERISNGQKYSNKTPAEGYTCSTQGEECFGFFTVGASTPGQFKNAGTAGTGIAAIDKQYTSYTSFGYFEVQLDESATTTECGRICVFADFASAGTSYNAANHITTNAVCAEIKPKASVAPKPNTPETGSFASITVLVAGALIAIAAIAIAKKNNKIYKV